MCIRDRHADTHTLFEYPLGKPLEAKLLKELLHEYTHYLVLLIRHPCIRIYSEYELTQMSNPYERQGYERTSCLTAKLCRAHFQMCSNSREASRSYMRVWSRFGLILYPWTIIWSAVMYQYASQAGERERRNYPRVSWCKRWQEEVVRARLPVKYTFIDCLLEFLVTLSWRGVLR